MFFSSLNPFQSTPNHARDAFVMDQAHLDSPLNAWFLRSLCAMGHSLIKALASSWLYKDMLQEHQAITSSDSVDSDDTYDILDDKDEIVQQRQDYLSSCITRGMFHGHGPSSIQQHCVPPLASNCVTGVEQVFQRFVAPVLPTIPAGIFMDGVSRSDTYYFYTSIAARQAQEVNHAVRGPRLITAATADAAVHSPSPTMSFFSNLPLTVRSYSLRFLGKSMTLCYVAQYMSHHHARVRCQEDEEVKEDEYSCFPAELIHQDVAKDDEDYDLVQEKEAQEWFPSDVRHYRQDAYHKQLLSSSRLDGARNKIHRWCRMLSVSAW